MVGNNISEPSFVFKNIKIENSEYLIPATIINFNSFESNLTANFNFEDLTFENLTFSQ